MAASRRSCWSTREFRAQDMGAEEAQRLSTDWRGPRRLTATRSLLRREALSCGMACGVELPLHLPPCFSTHRSHFHTILVNASGAAQSLQSSLQMPRALAGPRRRLLWTSRSCSRARCGVSGFGGGIGGGCGSTCSCPAPLHQRSRRRDGVVGAACFTCPPLPFTTAVLPLSRPRRSSASMACTARSCRRQGWR